MRLELAQKGQLLTDLLLYILRVVIENLLRAVPERVRERERERETETETETETDRDRQRQTDRQTERL